MNNDLISSHVQQAEQYEQQQNFSQAVLCYQQAHSLAIDLSIGTDTQDRLIFSILFCQQKLAQNKEAMFALLRAYDQFLLKITPHFPLSYAVFYNRAILLRSLGLYELSKQDIERCLSLKPDFLIAQKTLGELELALGDYKNGWQHYQARWFNQEKKQNLPLPQWHRNADPQGRIYLYFEQGIGDCLQFFRYVLVAKQLGFPLYVLHHPALCGLLNENLRYNDIEIIEGDVQVAYHASLMDMPYLCGTTLDNIPFAQGYLQAPQAMIEQWRLHTQKQGLKIGFCYTSNTQSTNVQQRNIDLSLFAQLFELNAEFHCLQKEISPTDYAQLSQYANVHLWNHALTDFCQTAGLIANMDIIISIDTAVAHLAGAMNKKTWILLAYQPDFRWLLERTDCPWYQSVQLYRQPDIGDWHTVLAQVKQQLTSLI